MAIFHASTKPVSRAAGRSATAAAAYRSGSRVVDRRTGEIHDYRKKGGVVAAGIVLPDGTRANHLREQLWNAAEEAEKRKDGRVAREWVVALPDELNKEQRMLLAAKFALKLAATYGVAADLAIHEPSKKGDDRNHHAHILLTTRQAKLTESGIELGEKASIELSDKARKERGMKPAADDVKRLRAVWAEMANAALAEAGHEARIDHRSHVERGLDEQPSIHLGPAATAIKRKGKKLDIEERERQRWEKAQKQVQQEREEAKREQKAANEHLERIEEAQSPPPMLEAQRKALEQPKPKQPQISSLEAFKRANGLPAETEPDRAARAARERAQAQAAEIQKKLEQYSSNAPKKAKDKDKDSGYGLGF